MVQPVADVFCHNLETLLAERHLTAAEFARRVRVNPSLVSHWLSGARFPRPHHIDRIAATLGVPVPRLFLDPSDDRTAPPEPDIETALSIVTRALRPKVPSEKS